MEFLWNPFNLATLSTNDLLHSHSGHRAGNVIAVIVESIYRYRVAVIRKRRCQRPRDQRPHPDDLIVLEVAYPHPDEVFSRAVKRAGHNRPQGIYAHRGISYGIGTIGQSGIAAGGCVQLHTAHDPSRAYPEIHKSVGHQAHTFACRIHNIAIDVPVSEGILEILSLIYLSATSP